MLGTLLAPLRISMVPLIAGSRNHGYFHLSVEERGSGMNHRVKWVLGLVGLSESIMRSDIWDNGEVEIVAGA